MVLRLWTLCSGRRLPTGRFLVLVSDRSWVDSRAIVRLEGLGQLKIPMTSSGIEPTTFRLVTECFNRLRYSVFPAVWNFQKHAAKKISVFWDTTLRSSFENQSVFLRNMTFHLQGWRISQRRYQHEEGSKESRQRQVSLNLQLIFKLLHGVIAQKIRLFITTAVRASDPTGCEGLSRLDWEAAPCERDGNLINQLVYWYPYTNQVFIKL
jgi:hypothetical protein